MVFSPVTQGAHPVSSIWSIVGGFLAFGLCIRRLIIKIKKEKRRPLGVFKGCLCLRIPLSMLRRVQSFNLRT